MESSLNVIEERVVLGKDFKIYGSLENPLFLATDVAKWIEYSKTTEGYYNTGKMLKAIDEDEKTTITNGNSGGKSTFLTEYGLYEVLMQSRKPMAKQFKKKVKEILKDVRKHGGYLTDEKIEEVLTNPDTIIKLATRLKEEKEKSRKLELENKRKEQLIGELKPKANYVDWILRSKSTVNINAIAKDYGISARQMNKILHELRVQYCQDKQWLLYSKYQGCGYTHSKTIEFKHTDDTLDTRLHTQWTQKGRLFLYDLLKKERNILPVIEKQKGA